MSIQTCSHIRVTGQPCGSPALRGETLCYYHKRADTHHLIHRGSQSQYLEFLGHNPKLASDPMIAEYFSVGPEARLTLDLPQLEDREAIQIAISTVVSALAMNRMTSRRAGMILYGLQLASANIRSIENIQPLAHEINTLETSPTE